MGDSNGKDSRKGTNTNNLSSVICWKEIIKSLIKGRVWC